MRARFSVAKRSHATVHASTYRPGPPILASGLMALLLALLLAMSWPIARAADGAFSQASTHVDALRQWVESAPADSVSAWLNEHFDARTMADRQDAIEAYFIQAHAELKGGQWTSLRQLSDLRGQLFVHDAAAGDIMLTFDFASDPPHGVVQMRADIELIRSPPTAIATDTDLVNLLDQTINQLSADDDFSGVVLLARGNQVLYQRAAGEADKGWSIPNRPETRFNLASTTKTLTGVMACRLMSDGVIGADDTVGDYLPDWPQTMVRDEVTVHHLLTHSSGLGSYWNDRYFQTWDRLRSVVDFLALIEDQTPAFTPGRGYRYSNAGYLLLGRMLEVASGKDFDQLTRDLIYGPSGMHESGAFEADHPVANIAHGYTFQSRVPQRQPQKSRRTNIFQKPIKGGPAGGTYATAGDLFSFSQALLDGQLLSDDWLERCTRNRIERPGGHYGYGFQIKTVNGRRILGHTGGSQGVDTALRIFPDSRHVVVILSNYDRGAQQLDDLLISSIAHAPVSMGDNPISVENQSGTIDAR